MRTILAAKDTDLRLALQLLLSEEPEVHFVGSANNANGLLALNDASHPDLVLMDIDLPGLPIQEVLAKIKASKPPAKIILMGSKSSPDPEITQAGADYYIQIGDPPEKLVETFRRIVLNHEMNDQNPGKEITKS